MNSNAARDREREKYVVPPKEVLRLQRHQDDREHKVVHDETQKTRDGESSESLEKRFRSLTIHGKQYIKNAADCSTVFVRMSPLRGGADYGIICLQRGIGG